MMFNNIFDLFLLYVFLYLFVNITVKRFSTSHIFLSVNLTTLTTLTYFVKIICDLKGSKETTNYLFIYFTIHLFISL